MVWQGMPNWEIGEQLKISRRTVEVHRASLMKRAKVHNAAQLLRWAVFNKLVPARPHKVA
jgi:DNA-binding CsgD family transcriptional regulator